MLGCGVRQVQTVLGWGCWTWVQCWDEVSDTGTNHVGMGMGHETRVQCWDGVFDLGTGLGWGMSSEILFMPRSRSVRFKFLLFLTFVAHFKLLLLLLVGRERHREIFR